MEVDTGRGTRIKDLRTERGWTQRQLADKIGVRHYQSVQAWERGRPMEYDNLLALARAFDVDVSALLGEDEPAEDDDVEKRVLHIEGALLSLLRKEVDALRTQLGDVRTTMAGLAAQVMEGLGELREASDGQSRAVEGLSDQVQALRSELRELRGIVAAPAETEAPARPQRKRPATPHQ